MSNIESFRMQGCVEEVCSLTFEYGQFTEFDLNASNPSINYDVLLPQTIQLRGNASNFSYFGKIQQSNDSRIVYQVMIYCYHNSLIEFYPGNLTGAIFQSNDLTHASREFTWFRDHNEIRMIHRDLSIEELEFRKARLHKGKI